MQQPCFDVLVVGGAVSGLATALFASLHGASVLVVEKHASSSPHPRARGFSQRTLELLRGTTAYAELTRLGGMPGETAGAVVAGPTLREATASAAAAPIGVPAETSPAPFVYLGQDRVEPILAEAARTAGAEIWLSQRFVTWQPDDGIATLHGGQRVRARFLVGADGARSAVRDAFGIERGGRGTMGHQVSALIEAELAAPDGRPLGFALLTSPATGGVLVATDRPHHYLFSVRHDPAREPVASFTPEVWRARLAAATDMPLGSLRVLGSFAWEPSERWADRFATADGRGFLVGDAAHQMVPAGGFGANAAIHDAANLGWKLGYVARGLAPTSLLASYDRERRPVAIATCRQATARAFQMSGAPRPDDLAVLVDDTAVVFGARYAGPAPLPTTFADDGAVGTRVPHAWVARDQSTLDVAGPDFALLAPALPAGIVDDLERHLPAGVRVRTAAVALAQGAALLVRPDQVVAARWPATPDAATIGATVERVLRDGLSSPSPG
jgi:2-polyprenyl-6-methoxyphenol hydroxylase-like FAD-dependent oxidoreductase